MTIEKDDVEDIRVILNEIKNMCVKFDYNDEKTAGFVYDVDMAVRSILSILNEKDV